MEDLAAIGWQLRSKWLQGEFHAVVSITVPRQPIELHSLPLSTDEWSRMRRFRRVMDCNRSVMGWIAVRGVVGAMITSRPKDVKIIRALNGKPSVYSGPGISISHAGDLAVVGFSSEMTIGVDVEQIDDVVSFLPTIMRTLSQSELSYLQAQAVEQQDLLVRAWVRKEAMAKVFGSGLSIDVQSLVVADRDGHRFQCRFPGENAIVEGADLEMGSDYIAALVSTGKINDVATYHVGGGFRLDD